MKLITETDCPHCNKSHKAELDLDNLQLPKEDIAQFKVKEVINSNPIAQNNEIPPQTKAEVKTVVKVPSHIPKFKCKNCDKLHDNPNYNKRPRFKCSNCGTLNPTQECEMCDRGEEFEELSDEDLDDLGIKAPNEKEHEHTHEDE